MSTAVINQVKELLKMRRLRGGHRSGCGPAEVGHIVSADPEV